jgi:hypothetical protein
MLKVEKLTVHGFEEAIRGMRNPYDSWDKSDTTIDYETGSVDIGDNDILLMRKLVAGGPVHAKFRRMITVSMDITAPLYWWKEYDTYKVGTVANSCSTMHTIAKKPFELSDFSIEHLLGSDNNPNAMLRAQIPTEDYDDGVMFPLDIMDKIIQMLEACRVSYNVTKDKRYWWQMIQLLPSSYNQTRTVMLNYEVLSNIYMWRKNHKLDEWHQFIDAVSVLPLFNILIAEE